MNDHDLRTALHRDADLVGSPPEDLMDQLSRRRQHQRRQRTGVGVALLGAVVIAAGIPLGQSLLNGSERDPDGRAAAQPTASAPTTSAPTTSATSTCPDAAELFAELPPPEDGAATPQLASPDAFCVGEWAVIGVGLYPTPGAAAHLQSVALFRYVDGSWQPQDSADQCAAGGLPAEIEQSVCNAG